MQIFGISSSFGGILRANVIDDSLHDGGDGIGRDAGEESFGEHDGMSIMEVKIIELAKLFATQG